MAVKTPLVLYGAQMAQLQNGDTLNVPMSGGQVITQTNDESTAIVCGTPVYNDAADGVKKAKADASATKDVMGLVRDASIAASASGVIHVGGVLSLTTAQWDAVAGTTGGLTKGTRYYLSAATSGLLTATAPSTVGQYVCEVGLAISTTELLVNPKSTIQL